MIDPVGGGGDRPGIGGDRPGIGGDRPGIGGDRPGIGGDRPGIGADRPGIGNRPGWDQGNWNNSGWGWGLGGGGWAGNWHNNCINPHYGWYNGCWNGGFWGSSWYRPLAWGAVGWGLGTLTSGWGYGTGYYNPYYSTAAEDTSVAYDYSQPVVVDNYLASDANGVVVAAAPQTSAEEQATQLFDAGLAQFKSGDYAGALTQFDVALQKLPGDPVVHEVRALTLFALGEYQPAAAALNSFLSSAPGMDWTTMSGLYGNDDDYQTQLRKLEQYCRTHPSDAPSHFVLAYQYLVIDAKDAAVNALRVVVKNQPKDSTAKRMLDALSPAAQPAASATAATPTDGAAPETDLVGNWRAKAGDTTIDLAITEDSQFTWKAAQPGKPAIELNGQLESTSDDLVLESKDKGQMAGAVKSLGPDKWHFALSGAPPSDPGLSFARVKPEG